MHASLDHQVNQQSQHFARAKRQRPSANGNFWATYKQAYGSAIRSAKWDQPGADEDTLKATGRDAGRSAVLDALMNGEAVTSNTQESYMDYWGSEWDKKHDAM